jgi:hypothetical protein
MATALHLLTYGGPPRNGSPLVLTVPDRGLEGGGGAGSNPITLGNNFRIDPTCGPWYAEGYAEGYTEGYADSFSLYIPKRIIRESEENQVPEGNQVPEEVPKPHLKPAPNPDDPNRQTSKCPYDDGIEGEDGEDNKKVKLNNPVPTSYTTAPAPKEVPPMLDVNIRRLVRNREIQEMMGNRRSL